MIAARNHSAMTAHNDPIPQPILTALGRASTDVLGQGGEAWVVALDAERVARVSRPGASATTVAQRTAILGELGRTAARVPFAIPQVLEALELAGHLVTIERRLNGRSLTTVLAESKGNAREALLRAYLTAAGQIGNLVVHRSYFGDLVHDSPLRTTSFRDYLAIRAQHNLEAGGLAKPGLDSDRLAAALPEPETAALVHLDAFAGNMLVAEGQITAVLDFGGSMILGDRRLDPLAAVVYLDPAITPTARAGDQAAAREWLAEQGLDPLYQPAQRWLAAYWSFARDDYSLYRWCRRILGL